MLKYKDFFAVIFVNVIFLIFCLFFGKLRYGALDDFFMAGVLTGIHGDAYNPHLYFVNALYGYALLPLYHLYPKIGWYYIFEMFGVFVSFVLISYVLIKKTGLTLGLCVSSVILSLLCSDFYLVVQFTQCAALYSAAGFSALLYSLNEKDVKVFIFAFIMIIWGSWMRWEAFLMGLPLLGIAVLFSIDELKKHTGKVIVSIFVLLVLVCGGRIFDKSLYDTEEYRPYKEIQGPRATFGDASNYNMQAVYEDLEEIGKSGFDYAMLTNWEFYDTEIFQVDSLREILKFVDYHRNKVSAVSVALGVLGTLNSSSGRPVFWLFVFLCLMLFLCNPKKSGYSWISLGCVLGLLAYLVMLNRVLYRVESGIWVYASILAIPLLKTKYRLPLNLAYAVVLVILFVNVFVFSQTGLLVRDPNRGFVENLSVIKDTTDYSSIFDYIEDNSDKIFLVQMNTYMKFAKHKNPPYFSEPIGSFKRTISFGYWTPYLPEITKTLNDFGITNPIKDVVHDNVISIDVGNLGEYLQRHYYDSVRVDIVNKIGNVVFYKYSVVDK